MRRGQLTHHGGSLVANDIGALFEGGGVHDAGGGDVHGHQVEAQQHTEVQQHDHHLEHWERAEDNIEVEGRVEETRVFSFLTRVR